METIGNGRQEAVDNCDNQQHIPYGVDIRKKNGDANNEGYDHQRNKRVVMMIMMTATMIKK